MVIFQSAKPQIIRGQPAQNLSQVATPEVEAPGTPTPVLALVKLTDLPFEKKEMAIIPK